MADIWSRRQFVQVGASLVSAPLLASCELRLPWSRQATVPHVGYLARQDFPPARIQGFKNGLAERGYVDGENIVIEWRWAPITEDLEPLAIELVARKVDVIVAGSSLAIQAAKKATSSIPIVMSASGDPVGVGLVANLARPGGNTTGLSSQAVGLAAKRMEIFNDAIPGMSRVGVMWDPASLDKENDLRETQAAALKLGVDAHPLVVSRRSEADRLSEMIAGGRFDAVMTLTDSFPADLAEAALRARIPSMCEGRGFPTVGGLMSYGPNPLVWYARTAEFVEKILKGAQPADLPVEQPTDIELVVNETTAQAIGLTFPPSIAMQAQEILR
jgi:putative ABC transport system substrate-binding protein